MDNLFAVKGIDVDEDLGVESDVLEVDVGVGLIDRPLEELDVVGNECIDHDVPIVLANDELEGGDDVLFEFQLHIGC